MLHSENGPARIDSVKEAWPSLAMAITTTKDGMQQRASVFRLVSLMYFAMVLLHSFQWRMWSNLSEFLEMMHF